MAHDNSRGTLYDPDTDTDLDMGKVTDEDVGLSTGLFRKAIPLTSADNAIFEAIWGKTRIITIEGEYHGTQVEIENFVEQIEDLADVDGFAKTLQYYPLVHPKNTGGEGFQNQYRLVLINSFNYRVSRDTAGFICFYDLELFEGKRVKDYIS